MKRIVRVKAKANRSEKIFGGRRTVRSGDGSVPAGGAAAADVVDVVDTAGIAGMAHLDASPRCIDVAAPRPSQGSAVVDRAASA